MVAAPAETPVTMPVEPTVATPVFDELHVPPAVALASVVVAPAHNDAAPVVALTDAVPVATVTVLVAVPAQLPVVA